MCYKDEVQKKNAEKLNRMFKEENVPQFIVDYFCTINSEAGKLNYWSVIKAMINWMILNGRIEKESISDLTPRDIDKLSKTDIIIYLDDLLDGGMMPSTISTKKNILSGFWTHLLDEDLVSKHIINSIPKTKFKIKKKNNAKVPLQEDLDEMVENIKKKNDMFVRERNLTILRVLKGTGLRQSELAGLDFSDLHLDSPHPYITVMGKGVYYKQDEEQVLVTKDAKEAFLKWLTFRNQVKNVIDEKAVFLNKNGRRLSEENIKAIFKKYSNSKITPHMIRHLYATTLYKETGYDAAFVQEQLRHSDVNTTLGTYAAGSNRSYDVLETM